MSKNCRAPAIGLTRMSSLALNATDRISLLKASEPDSMKDRMLPVH
jgi:hypothetical protein